MARKTTVAHLERVVRQWEWICGGDERELERARSASRRLTVAPDDEGMYVIRGRLPAEVGGMVMRTIEAAADADDPDGDAPHERDAGRVHRRPHVVPWADGWDLLPRSYHDPCVRWRDVDTPAFEALEAAWEE